MSISPEESSPTHFGKGQECVQGITEPTQHPSHESPILSEKQHHLQESEDPGIYHDDLPIFDFNVPGGNCNFEQPINSQSTPPDDNEVTATENVDDDVDAMGVISHFPNPINGRKRKLSNYFGPSSTKGLLDKAHGRCPSLSETCTTSPSQVRGSLTSHASPANTHGFKSNGGVFGMVIPSRAEADSLISSYWHWTHSLYPFIHRPSFEQRYLTVWYPHTQSYTTDKSRDSTTAEGIYANISDRLFYCMLNTVFSLGALFSSRIDQEDRASVAYTFYERAKQLLDIDLLADGSLALVQTLLLMGQYLQSTDMSNSCWNIIGLAVRVAQCIGLHHDPQACDQGCCSTQSFEQVDIEMRRRAWTGCIMLDR